MIKFDGQIVYTFSIGDKKDFISVENLKSFRLFETAGNIRPIMHLSFELEDKDLIKYLNAGNILTISFGVDEVKKETIMFELFNDDTNLNRNLGYDTTIKGALYLPKFTNDSGCHYYGNKTSLEVISSIAEDNKFNLNTNIKKTNDKQEWFVQGQTTWDFLRELWLSSYINDDTFTSLAFDDSNIYFYDMKELCSQPAKWIFSNERLTNENSNVINIGGYTVSNDYGNVSQLIGKNLINKVYNIDTGEFQDISYKLKNFTTIESDKLNLNSNDCKDYQYSIISNDNHSNYVKAWNQNVRNNIMYSTFNIYTQTAGQLKKLKLLDTVKFELYPKDERLDGIAFITGIVYEYNFGNLNINVTLNKEAPSGIVGSNLKEGD